MRSAFSAERPSMMSQPVRKASAPRLAPARRKWRRVGAGRSLAASLARSAASTPETDVRERDIPRLLAAPDHGPQALRHDDRHRDMDGEEDHDCGHGEEMDEPRGVISAEQGGQLAQLYRLPDG